MIVGIEDIETIVIDILLGLLRTCSIESTTKDIHSTAEVCRRVEISPLRNVITHLQRTNERSDNESRDLERNIYLQAMAMPRRLKEIEVVKIVGELLILVREEERKNGETGG